jgi:hypothetical protein
MSAVAVVTANSRRLIGWRWGDTATFVWLRTPDSVKYLAWLLYTYSVKWNWLFMHLSSYMYTIYRQISSRSTCLSSVFMSLRTYYMCNMHVASGGRDISLFISLLCSKNIIAYRTIYSDLGDNLLSWLRLNGNTLAWWVMWDVDMHCKTRENCPWIK